MRYENTRAHRNKTPKDRTKASKIKNHHHFHWWQVYHSILIQCFLELTMCWGYNGDQNRPNSLSFDSWGGGHDKVGKTSGTQDSERTVMKKATGQEQRGIMGEWEIEDRTPQSVSQHTPHDAETLDKAPRVFQAGGTADRPPESYPQSSREAPDEETLVQGLTSPSCWGGPSLNRLDDATWPAHVAPPHIFCHGRV